MRLIIHDIPRSPNGPRGLLRMHWAARKRYNELWRAHVRSQIQSTQQPPEGKQHVFISQMRKRQLDPDNLVASCKPILDALVHWGLIADDDGKHIELSCMQVTGREPMTIIQVGRI